MKISAVVLAGGRSSRMGRDKAWLEIGGQSLLARQIQLAGEAGAQEVFISGRAGANYSEFGCRVLQDRLVDAGPLDGIQSALSAAAFPLLLVLAVDMPRMTAGFLHKLLLCCDSGRGAIPRVDGAIEPLAAFFPRGAVGLIGTPFSARHESPACSQPLFGRAKSPSATAFAEGCVGCGLARFVEIPGSESHYFSNWNSPEDVE